MKPLEVKSIPLEICDIQHNQNDSEFTNLQEKLNEQENNKETYFELMESVLFLEEAANSDMINYNMESVKITVDFEQMSIKPVR